jgi:hypothetical protein
MTTLLTPETLSSLQAESGTPCLSLYQRTHRHHPDNTQDPIRFRNLVKALETSLLERMSAEEAAPVLAPFEALGRNASFWKHTLDGLAVLATPQRFEVFVLQRPVPDLAIVADSLHTKPLRRFLQSVDRYQVLGINRQRVRLFEGDRDVLDELPLHPDVPPTLTDALGDELTGPHLTVASYGGVGGASGNMRHGHGSKKDEVHADTERFFRVVDRAVWEHHSRPSGLPLVLAALAEHHDRFRKASHNAQLVEPAIAINPESVPTEKLRDLAWAVMEPRYQDRVKALVGAFEQARAKSLAAEELAQIGPAVAAGRVATLLIEAERHIGGRLDEATGNITFAEIDDPHVDDVLDDLAERVEKMDGQVYVLPTALMPTTTGAAAVLRF